METALGMPEGMTVTTAWCGQSVERVEDAALLTGRGRFIDDLGVRPGTLHAAVLRSPHAYARITAVRLEAARAAQGVAAVLSGADVTALSASLVAGVKAPIECWPIAVDHSLILKLLRMAETEAHGLLVIILRMRGGNGTVRRHGQEAAVSWSAGVDHTSGQVAMTTTDVFSNVSDSYLMQPEQFERLVDYLVAIKQQMHPNETRSDDICKPR